MNRLRLVVGIALAAFFIFVGRANAFWIYYDSLSVGWQDWSWNMNLYWTAASPRYSGSYSLQAYYNVNWSGIYFNHTTGLYTDGNDAVLLAIYNSTHSGQNLYVELYGANNQFLGSVPLGNYIPQGYLPQNIWRYATIPLEDLNAGNVLITGFSLVSPTIGLVYLDAIEIRDAGFDPLIPYAEGFGPGWNKDWSWSAVIDPYGAVPYVGSYGLGVAFTSNWGAAWLRRENNISTSGSNALSFFVRPESAGEELYVSLAAANDGELGYVPVSAYTTLPAGTWTNVTIPLADLNGVNRTVGGIIVQSASTGNFSFDEVTFVSLPSCGGSSASMMSMEGATLVSETRAISMEVQAASGGQCIPTNHILYYTDSFPSNVQNWSWNVGLGSPKVTPYKGSSALMVNWSAAWGGLWLQRTSGFNPNVNALLSFTVHGAGSGGQNLWVTVADTAGNTFSYVPLTNYLPNGSIPADDWQFALIPMRAMIGSQTPVNPIAGLVIQSATATTVYLDEIKILEAFTFPLAGKSAATMNVTGPFGEDWVTYCPAGVIKKHSGTDMSASGGNDVVAMMDGVVKRVFEDTIGGWAYVIVVDHYSSFETVYWHVNPLVNTGDIVSRGDHIADVANLTPYGNATHFHSGIRLNKYDPDHSIAGGLPQTDCGVYSAFPEFFVNPQLLLP